MKNKFIKLHHDIENDSIRMISLKTALIKFFLDKGYYFDVQIHLTELLKSYTFDHILSLWAGRKIRLLDEAKIYLNTDEIVKIMQILFDEEISLKEENELFISEIYQNIFCSNSRVTDISEFIADILRHDIKLNDRLIDPFCGSGLYISGMYDALMHAHYKQGSTQSIEKIHKKLLTENIYGFVTTDLSCAVSNLVLALKYKEFTLSKNIICRKFFAADEKKVPLFDWVIADLSQYNSVDHISSVYENFQYVNRFLNSGGKLVCVFDRSILNQMEGKELRKKLLGDYTILKVIDMPDNHISIDPNTLNVVFYLEKGVKFRHLFEVLHIASDGRENLPIQFSDVGSIMALQDDLNENGFEFYDQSKTKLMNRITSLCSHTLGDVVHFFQGIISGCDKAFVVHDNSLIYSQCINECGVPWIKGKDINDQINFYGQYLLYTNGGEGIDHFPLTKKRLEIYKSLLKKRRECIKGVRHWYELQWGRDKELFLKEKILFAAKSKKNNFIYDDQGYFFSADVYGAASLDSVNIDLKKLSLLLNSDIYEWYMKSVMKKINNGRYAYYPDTLKNICIPPLDVIASFKDEADIHQYFGFNIGEANE